MENLDFSDEITIRNEDGIFLKGVFGSRLGTIILTDMRIFFYEQKQYAIGGAVGTIAQQAANKAKPDRKLKMSIPLGEVASYERTKKGLNKNVLLITSKDGKSYKVSLGSEYEEWVPLLEKYIPLN